MFVDIGLAQLTPMTSVECGRNIEWDIEDTCTLWKVIGKKFAYVRSEDVQRVVEVSFQIIDVMGILLDSRVLLIELHVSALYPSA